MLFGTPAYIDPGLPDVPVVANNIADLAAVLTDPDLGGFDPAHCVTVLADVGMAEVGDLLMQAATEVEDLLLFYYSGHGLPWHRAARVLYVFGLHQAESAAHRLGVRSGRRTLSWRPAPGTG